jgi:hypothetical protein
MEAARGSVTVPEQADEPETDVTDAEAAEPAVVE